MFVIVGEEAEGKHCVGGYSSPVAMGQLSGADVEGIAGHALRISLLAGSETIIRDGLAQWLVVGDQRWRACRIKLCTKLVLDCVNRSFTCRSCEPPCQSWPLFPK